jgi:flavin reductase (DIM6/NTAB) family NADH-FMN oxidoreductase RutF/DNA-binding GntR family transcriptional regulator
MTALRHKLPPEEALSGAPNIRLVADEFRAVMGQFASGVTIVSTREEGQDYGTTASAFTSLSLEPPMALACLYRGAATEEAIRRSGRFGISILRDDQQEIAERFASRHPDRFGSIEHRYGELGVPLVEGALAHVECRVAETVVGGTHTVLLGLAWNARRYSGRPLAYFGGAFGHFLVGDDAAVYKAIRAMIAGGALGPGHVLVAEALAEQLGGEPASVLAALKRLRAEGRVGRDPDGTYLVGGLDRRAALDMVSACRTVEVGVAELTVGWVDDAALDGLEALASAPCEAMPRRSGDDPPAAPEAAFHEHLVGLAGNPRLLDHYRELSTAAAYAGPVENAHGPCDDHQAIVAGYRAGDLPSVIAAIDRHARRLREAWQQVADGRPPGR